MKTAKLATNIQWFFLAFFAIGVGLYPLIYLVSPTEHTLLGQKTQDLLATIFYLPVFYCHIGFGGLALLTGWSQFSKKLRAKNLGLHKLLGKIYVGSVVISGVAGLSIAFYATGGILAQTGFMGLALAWLYTTIMAFIKVRKKQISVHQDWMIRSYALCFAAVTLRIWMPAMQIGLSMDFIPAYKVVAWLCWVPNLLAAEFLLISKNKLSSKPTLR